MFGEFDSFRGSALDSLRRASLIVKDDKWLIGLKSLLSSLKGKVGSLGGHRLSRTRSFSE